MVWLGSTSLLLVDVAPVGLVWHVTPVHFLSGERLVARPDCAWSMASNWYWLRRAFCPYINRALLVLTTRVYPPSTLRLVGPITANMSGRLRTIIISVSALLQLSSASPADPTITAPAVLPRQNSDNFVGYVELNNTCKHLQKRLRASLTKP